MRNVSVETGDIAAGHTDKSDVAGDHGSWDTNLGCSVFAAGNCCYCQVSSVKV